MRPYASHWNRRAAIPATVDQLWSADRSTGWNHTVLGDRQAELYGRGQADLLDRKIRQQRIDMLQCQRDGRGQRRCRDVEQFEVDPAYDIQHIWGNRLIVLLHRHTQPAVCQYRDVGRWNVSQHRVELGQVQADAERVVRCCSIALQVDELNQPQYVGRRQEAVLDDRKAQQ